MSSSFEASCNVPLFALGGACVSPWPSRAPETVSGKSEISSPVGKATLGCAGGRRLLMRGTSASAIRNRVKLRMSLVAIANFGQPPAASHLLQLRDYPSDSMMREMGKTATAHPRTVALARLGLGGFCGLFTGRLPERLGGRLSPEELPRQPRRWLLPRACEHPARSAGRRNRRRPHRKPFR